VGLGGVNMIKKTNKGYIIVDHKGKKIAGPYKTEKQVERRLRQIEYWKNKKSKE
jgi:hypothetical protein